MYICENCQKEHDGTFGSGRFCSKKCARGFSTKAKRSLINEQVSKKLSKPAHKKKCLSCNIEFTTKKKHQKFCSKTCSASYINKQEDCIKTLSLKRIEKIIEGKVNNYGTKMIYKFNSEEIRCDSKIEYACLNYFEKLGAIKIKRCNFFIEYMDGTKIRRFNPDFEIVTNKEHYIVEAKSYMSIKSVNEKWRKYNELSVLKKDALQKYCQEQNLTPFWFTKDLNLKFYKGI